MWYNKKEISSVIRSGGSPRYAMAVLLTGAVLNIVLNPICIFAIHSIWAFLCELSLTCLNKGVFITLTKRARSGGFRGNSVPRRYMNSKQKSRLRSAFLFAVPLSYIQFSGKRSVDYIICRVFLWLNIEF